MIRRVMLIVLFLTAMTLGAQEPPFKVRGIKGLWWEGIEKYQKALPWVADHDLNFLMLCYTSFPASGKDWRSNYTEAELKQIGELAKEADRRQVELCLSFNPGIWSNPPLVYGNGADFKIALEKVKTIHGAGVRSFALCLDDINRQLDPRDLEQFGNLAAAQVHFVNALWKQLHALDPSARLIFCPSAYTTRDAEQHPDYIETIGGGIDSGVFMFWTGPGVCSPTITVRDAKHFAQMIHRKPIVWDNYPVNDMFPWRPLLAAVKGRSAKLGSEVEGLMSNPMKQWEASRIPLATLTEYLHDPAAYDPQRAMENSIDEFDAKSRPIVKLLVDLYGRRFLGEAGYPQYPHWKDAADAKVQLARYQELDQKLPAVSKGLYNDVKPTLDADIDLLQRKSRDRKLESPLVARGDDFEDGGAARFGSRFFGKNVDYVYAMSTKLDSMKVSFWIKQVPQRGATLRLEARDDDSKKTPKIRITLNDHEVYEGPSPFTHSGFSSHDFAVERKDLVQGENLLTIRNIEESGTAGMPPWFMVSLAELLTANP